MRRAVIAAEDAARAVHDALARGIGHRHAVGFHAQPHIAAIPSAELSIARRPWAILMGFEHQREPAFRNLDRAELDAAGGMPFANGGITISRRRSAASGPSLEHMPDEAPSGARVGTVQRDPQS